MKTKTKHYKCAAIIFIALFLFIFLPKISLAVIAPSPVEWSLIWQQTGARVSPQYAVFYDVAVDSSYVYAVGTTNDINGDGIIQKRNLNDGSLVWEQIITDGTLDVAYGVAVGPDGIYIAGGGGSSVSSGPINWRMEKRSLDNGALLWGLTTLQHVAVSSATGVAIDSGGVYFVGTVVNPNNGVEIGIWQKRSLTDPALQIWLKQWPLPPMEESVRSPKIAISSDGVYVSGFGVNGDIFAKIDPASGTKINTWASGLCRIYDIALDSDGIYMSGMIDHRATVVKFNYGAVVTPTWIYTSSVPVNSIFYGLTVNSAGVYAVGVQGGVSISDSTQWLISKIDLGVGGSLLWIRWTIAESLGGSGGEGARAIAVDGMDIYTVGSVDFRTSAPEGSQWYIEKRSNIPSVPLNLTANAVSCSQINLSWEGSIAVTRYELQRSDTPLGGSYNWSDISTNIPSDAVNYLDYFGLAEQKIYFYQIRACNDNGCSEYSNIAPATTPACPIIKLEVKDPATGLFTTGPVTISLGSSTEIQWTTSGIIPDTCHASTNPPNSGNWHDKMPDNSVSPFIIDKITQNTTFYLTCTDSYTNFDVTNFVIVNTTLLPQWKEVAP